MQIALADARPGDFIFCHSTGIVSRAIRWGTHGEYNHVAWLDRFTGAPAEKGDPTKWVIGQAESRGVTRTAILDTVAPGGTYVVVRLPDECDIGAVLDFLRAQVGERYGWLTIASIVLTLKLPAFVNIMAPGTWICSALTAEAARFGGWYHEWPDIYQATPQQFFDALEAT